MAFEISGLSYDFHNGNAVANLNKTPDSSSRDHATIMVNFKLKAAPSGGTPDTATQAEIRLEAKRQSQAPFSLADTSLRGAKRSLADTLRLETIRHIHLAVIRLPP